MSKLLGYVNGAEKPTSIWLAPFHRLGFRLNESELSNNIHLSAALTADTMWLAASSSCFDGLYSDCKPECAGVWHLYLQFQGTKWSSGLLGHLQSHTCALRTIIIYFVRRSLFQGGESDSTIPRRHEGLGTDLEISSLKHQALARALGTTRKGKTAGCRGTRLQCQHWGGREAEAERWLQVLSQSDLQSEFKANQG